MQTNTSTPSVSDVKSVGDKAFKMLVEEMKTQINTQKDNKRETLTDLKPPRYSK